MTDMEMPYEDEVAGQLCRHGHEALRREMVLVGKDCRSY